MSGSGSAESLPQITSEDLTFDRQSAWNFFFSPKEKIGLDFLKWEEIFLSVQSRSARADRSWRKRGEREAALVRLQHCQNPPRRGRLPLGTPARRRGRRSVVPRPIDGSRMKQKPERSDTPQRETKDQTERTEKAERLKDDRRGFSVVIYNRDCKMVN